MFITKSIFFLCENHCQTIQTKTKKKPKKKQMQTSSKAIHIRYTQPDSVCSHITNV